jgi:hypothetical protein
MLDVLSQGLEKNFCESDLGFTIFANAFLADFRDDLAFAFLGGAGNNESSSWTCHDNLLCCVNDCLMSLTRFKEVVKDFGDRVKLGCPYGVTKTD